MNPSTLDILLRILRNFALLAFVGVVAVVLWEIIVRPLLLRPLAELRRVLEIYRIREQQRAFLEAEAKRVAGLKATIVSVGGVEQDPGGTLHLLAGWEFDCSNGTPVHRVDGNRNYLYCGYTKAELLEIHSRADEFNCLRKPQH